MAVSATDVLPGPGRSPRLAADVLAFALTGLGCVLLGAPVGLLWAAVAPRVDVVVADGGTTLAEPSPSGFIAADVLFLALVVAAGLLCGVAAWALAGQHGPGAVVGLAVGGLLAAEVARRSGQLVDAGQALAAAEAGQQGVVELSVRLRSAQALVGWPVAALAAHLVLTLLESREGAAVPR
jgi:hypothetical protein